VDPVPDPLLLRKSSSARNRSQNLWVCSQELSARPQRQLAVILEEKHIDANISNISKESSSMQFLKACGSNHWAMIAKEKPEFMDA
jgi:hypothetical protein